MDANRFAALSRQVGAAPNRRAALGVLAAGLTGALVLGNGTEEAEAGIPIVNCKVPGKKCKGKLGKVTTVKKTKKKTLAIKSFNKKFPAGVQLEVIVSKAGFKTQVKIVQVRKNKVPSIVTRCQTPPSTKRKAC